MHIVLVAALVFLGSPGGASSPRPEPQISQDSLLRLGDKAPAFEVDTPAGTKMSLAKAMKGKKATLVNFWFYG